ncbi:MAG: AmmeMemoRadiSam system radical SAM enzyme [Phaeodactylibacter sp.]|nr:AmmeMemoRadiSam system radical SAM enzyme [Phaeodactylibacter sp.]MCB9054133.1 AmmeMemoRadiSam system radical SAM enzyme [Lewinellaceae bacterium]
MHEAILYEPMEKKAVRCTACKIRCVVKPGGAGVCGVRQNMDGKLYLLVYGKASAVNIDPIEKKPLYHFLPGSQIFSIGTIGCNFACSFCQNWDISQLARTLREQLMKEKHIQDIEMEVGQYGYELSPERAVGLCLEKKVPSIAYTYNEPVIFFEYLHDISTLARQHGIRTVFVSNGYESEEALEQAGGYLDAMNIDLKSFRDEFYKKLCKARLQPVLDTIREVHKKGIWLEVTTLVIPGQNDSKGELREIAGFLASISPDIPWHISAFHPAYQMKDVPYTSRTTLEKAYDIGLAAGLRYIYLGNIQDEERSTTYCPNCGAALIRRTGYRTTLEHSFSNGRCLRCRTKISGIWQ